MKKTVIQINLEGLDAPNTGREHALHASVHVEGNKEDVELLFAAFLYGNPQFMFLIQQALMRMDDLEGCEKVHFDDLKNILG